MIIEYIKRGQRLGYENGILIYKLAIDETVPEEEALPPEEEDEAS